MTSKSLALITGFGGINSAGRSSSYLSYKNMVFDSLSSKEQLEVLQDLAVLQGKIEPIGRSWETSSWDTIDLKKFTGKPGNIIIFNDRLLHGGYTTPSKTRVSLELTLIIK